MVNEWQWEGRGASGCKKGKRAREELLRMACVDDRSSRPQHAACLHADTPDTCFRKNKTDTPRLKQESQAIKTVSERKWCE